jgi:succinate dehydrogenase / fumarate reductase membrane anchor subunit
LGKVRGLGSAKEGANHFIAQRVTAIALLFLVPWFLISLLSAASGDYAHARAFVSQPINAVLLLLTSAATFWHMRLGLQVIIEDYISNTGSKIALLIANTFVAAAAFTACAYAILTLAVTAGA